MNNKWHLSMRTISTVAALILAATALPVQTFAQGDNGKGNAYGKNKDYPYGVNQTSSRPYIIGLWGDLPRNRRPTRSRP
jgi:hypothetical protein